MFSVLFLFQCTADFIVDARVDVSACKSHACRVSAEIEMLEEFYLGDIFCAAEMT